METSPYAPTESPQNAVMQEIIRSALTAHIAAVKHLLDAPLPPCPPELAEVMTKYVTWEICGTCLHFHLSDTTGASISEKLATIRRDLDYLAQALLGHPEVETVVGTSWIIAKNPALLARWGFTFDGNIDEADQARDYPQEKRPMARATISRGAFLERYLRLCTVKKRGHHFP